MLGMGVAAATAALTVLLRDPIAGIYTDDLQVIGLAATLLFFAAIYQISDSVQVVAAAACAVTRTPRPSSTSPSSPIGGWVCPPA